MDKILLTAAFAWEVISLIHQWKMKPITGKNEYKIYSGENHCGNVKLVITGMGLKASGIVLTKCLEKEQFRLIINLGAAGSLCYDLSPGKVFIPESFIAEEMTETRAMAKYKAAMENACRNSGLDYQNGRLFSSDFGINKNSMKKSIIEKYNAKAVDMEAAAQAAIAEKNRIPFVCLKVITDRAKFPVLPSYFLNLLIVNRTLEKVCYRFIQSIN